MRGVPNRALLRTEEVHAAERKRQAESDVAELIEFAAPEAAQLLERKEQQRGRDAGEPQEELTVVNALRIFHQPKDRQQEQRRKGREDHVPLAAEVTEV